MKTIIGILFTVFVIAGCSDDFFKKEVEAPENSIQPQLVIHSYISPQNPEINVSVQMSIPSFGKQKVFSEAVTNAVVTIYNEQNEQATIPFEDTKNSYSLSTSVFPIFEGKTYRLEVRDSKGNRATAQCTVPQNITGTIQNLKLVNTKEEGSDAYQVTFDFQDTPNVKNYYISTALLYGYYTEILKIKPFTDKNRDGEIISVRSEKRIGSFIEKNKIDVTLSVADIHYYEYLKTVSAQVDSEDLGPFAEPIFILSNVKGGLGVFGAYCQKSLSLEL